MEIGSEKCDFGVDLDEDCNKLHYIRKSGIRPFCSIDTKASKVFAFIMRQSWGLPLKTGSINVVIHLRSIRSTSKVGKRYQRTSPRHF